jgi:hypothetical protein
MEKWEYTFITCNQKGKDWFVKTINDIEVDRWDDKNCRQTPYQCAVKLGAEGWEMTQVITAVGRNFSDDTYRLYFKRAKA